MKLMPVCSQPVLAAALSVALVSTSYLTAQVPGPTAPGAGNAQAILTAQGSPLVQSAYSFIALQSAELQNANLRKQTLDALTNEKTCILHRAKLKTADKQTIVNELLAQGLLNPADNLTFPGGLITGVFPPVLNEPSACPHLPQPFYSAPGSSFGGHHSYPGGLPVHESNNDTADLNLAKEYGAVYGGTEAGAPVVNIAGIYGPLTDDALPSALKLDHDLILGAPLWHDWAKSIVFQWNADGTEFPELNIGGSGKGLDGFSNTAGDSRTGGHHILSIAEAMLRGFSPAFIITQASAHSAPTNGNEYKVVNWIRAAAIVAKLDPIANEYLVLDAQGNYRLPAIKKTGEVNLNAAGQPFILTEYQLHNISDSDFIQSGPAVTDIQLVLAQLAPSFGYSTANVAAYNNKYRNVIFANYSAERLYAIYTNAGVQGVSNQIAKLHADGKL